MGKLRTHTAGSRLAIVLTTVIVTTVVLAGGVALATVGLNSVGSAQIKNGSIKSADIGNGQVKTSDIANGTVNSADVRDNSIKGVDLRNGTVTAADLAAATQPAGVNFAEGSDGVTLGTTDQSMRSVVLDAPAAGHVIVTANASVLLNSDGHDLVSCSITDGAIALDPFDYVSLDDFGAEAMKAYTPLSVTNTFAVPAGPPTFHLVCLKATGAVSVEQPSITALYVPELYAP